MKGFIGLALLLLVPATAYVQVQHFEHRLQPGLQARVLEVMESEGVEQPEVQMEFLDATLLGRVESEERRREVADRVNALPGVRVRSGGNRIGTLGWLRLAREEGAFLVDGLVPSAFTPVLPEEIEQSGWIDRLSRRETADLPSGIDRWNEFLAEYFEEPGDRSVELRPQGLRLAGDATSSMRLDWLAGASGVVDKERVSEEFTLHPSRYHLPGYAPASLPAGEDLDRLRAALAQGTIQFRRGSKAVPEAEREKIAAVAAAIGAAGPDGRYLVGGHPQQEGNATGNAQLARARADGIAGLLEEAGVDPDQLEVVGFGVAGGAQHENQVEILVR